MCKSRHLQKFIPVCLRMSTVVLHHVYICDCEQLEHNAGLILVAISCLLHLATKFLGVVLRVLQPSQYTSGIGKISVTSSDRHNELALQAKTISISHCVLHMATS